VLDKTVSFPVQIIYRIVYLPVCVCVCVCARARAADRWVKPIWALC